MKITPAGIDGALLVAPHVHGDSRGFFAETFRAEAFLAVGVREAFVQDNHSRSVHGTLRGLHGQRRNPQGKLIRVVRGEIYDVGVDLRPGSATFGAWVAQTLSADNHLQLYLPPGFLHGFCVVSDIAEVEYKCTAYYDPKDEFGVIWNDPDLAIPWPVGTPLLSEKDGALPFLSAVRVILAG